MKKDATDTQGEGATDSQMKVPAFTGNGAINSQRFRVSLGSQGE